MTFDCESIGRLSDNGMTKETIKCTSVGSQGVLAGREGNCTGILQIVKFAILVELVVRS